jgi:phage terminase small subunit|nr:MAG TPA: Terminase small subunit [Caudoviricetes sp.]DAV96652.1 MAG TPA: Terminase small subunit [Caudoviricetes sp.]DAW14194.1 MAG TPA: Terminase small subunit [Caudoviricetes sp.]
MDLTPKQKAFADEFLKCGNATEAAKRAGYSEQSARQMGTENLSKPSISSYIQERQKQIDDERIADIAEIQRFYSSVLRGEVKDQFGLDASLETRIAAGRELMKRFEKAESNKNDSCGITIINNIPRPEKQDG